MTKCEFCEAEARVYGYRIKEGRVRESTALCLDHSKSEDESAMKRGRERLAQDGGPFRQHCPRSDEPSQRNDSGESEWIFWGDDNILTCSYCGSIHPDEFMVAVEDGTPLGLTGKNYKVYVRSLQDKEPVRMVHAAKFYFQHLSDEQYDRFHDLLNTGRVRFEGEPHD